MPTPIFVLGKHRSGTTWLANLLCQHPQIAGVQHARHHGIHESAFFSHVYGRYGDLTVWSRYAEFVEVVAASDYFRLAGATREFLYSLWPTSYEGVFRAVMDRFAAQKGADYWVEKTPAHTLWVDRLARLYPDALFLAVHRPVEHVVASALGLAARHDPAHPPQGWARRRLITETALSWVHYNRTIDTFAARSPRILRVRYESLRSDLMGSMKSVCAFLGVPFTPECCRQVYRPNTSFPDGAARQRSLSEGEARWARIVAAAARRAPRPWLALASAIRHAIRRPGLPRWFFPPPDEPGARAAVDLRLSSP